MKLCPKAIFLHCLPRGSEVEENVLTVNNQKFGNKLPIEFMFKNLYCFIALVNYGNGNGLSEF